MTTPECNYCRVQYTENQNYRAKKRFVKLNEHGLCTGCEKQFPDGVPRGLTFKNDHRRYTHLWFAPDGCGKRVFDAAWLPKGAML